MKKPVFVGSAVALITPFNEGGVDTKKLKALIDFHLAHKTDRQSIPYQSSWDI